MKGVPNELLKFKKWILLSYYVPGRLKREDKTPFAFTV